MVKIFAIIELVLRLLKIWDQFLDFVADEHFAEIEARRQIRDKAVDDSKKAETDEDIWDAQKRIGANTPRP